MAYNVTRTEKHEEAYDIILTLSRRRYDAEQKGNWYQAIEICLTELHALRKCLDEYPGDPWFPAQVEHMAKKIKDNLSELTCHD